MRASKRFSSSRAGALGAAGLLALLLGACAGQPVGAPDEQARSLPELSPGEREALLAERPVVPLETAGFRLEPRYPPGSNVRVYTREELRSTGATSLGEALRELDPRLW